MSATTPASSGSRLRGFFTALAVMALILLAVGSIVWSLTWAAPSWYDPPTGDSAAAVELAGDVEYEVLVEATQIRPDEEAWALTVTEDEVNSWLAIRLPEWLYHHHGLDWPEELDAPQVTFLDGQLRLAMGVRGVPDGRTRVFGGAVTLRFEDEAQPVTAAGQSLPALRAKLERLWIGRIPLPGEPIDQLRSTLRERADPEVRDDPSVQWALRFLAGEQAVVLEPELSDGRRVRILAIEPEPGQAKITCRTIAASAPRPDAALTPVLPSLEEEKLEKVEEGVSSPAPSG